MRKKLILISIILVIFSVLFFHTDPLRMFTNFVIAGIVPGLNISLGFFPCLIVLVGLIYLVIKWVGDIHFEMIRQTALEMNAEKVKKQLDTANTQEQKERQRIIAAPSLESVANS